jgi:hypothetical protein
MLEHPDGYGADFKDERISSYAGSLFALFLFAALVAWPVHWIGVSRNSKKLKDLR